MTRTAGDVRIRPYRPRDAVDAAALRRICVRTGELGGDARGHFHDPGVLPALFATPYAELDTGLAFVADDGDPDGPIGYIVGAPDTEAYYRDFRARWLPRIRDRFPVLPGRTDRDGELRALLHEPERMIDAEVVREYPAHLHIDLLPHGQRRGLGTRLMTAYRDALRERGVPGLHLAMNPANAAAHAFYLRYGFRTLREPSEESPVLLLGLRL
ncbi:GNAT family N-acetyltransferase [Streptomyces harbinensis]|uniref:GNAT family N-acetyltransferase n=1 Tax=Streptomyces harbinensis TaxID=1176198 RepID=UPI000B8373F6|nr:GNAT family N-acetyltransferase [Streptomyces harbinensis]